MPTVSSCVRRSKAIMTARSFALVQNVLYLFCQPTPVSPFGSNCLVGLVVKASASRVEDPGLESRLRRDFFGVESYQ